jgi:hypothetical protein
VGRARVRAAGVYHVVLRTAGNRAVTSLRSTTRGARPFRHRGHHGIQCEQIGDISGRRTLAGRANILTAVRRWSRHSPARFL